MDSPQSVVSPFKTSSLFAEPERQNANIFVKNQGYLSREVEVQRKEAAVGNLESFLSVLEVYIHQARDIHNICIYQKQDVYAKLCITSDPENTVSTQIINGGGKNPVFNENLRLNVRTVDSSLKCEIWMLSRVRNYLEDQLLGFALVPLSEVLIRNGKLEKEFSLSSNDMFHSPAGFVQLSLSYVGASPEVVVIPKMATDAAVQGVEVPESAPCEFDKIEFPDPKIVNEDHLMVSEYFGIPCADLESQSSESLVSSDTENHLNSEVEANVFQTFCGGTSVEVPGHDSPPNSESTNGTPSASLPASSPSSDTAGASKSPNWEPNSHPKGASKEQSSDARDVESNASGGLPGNTFGKPIVTLKIEPEPEVVQQEIVDMYMKSMQQFTESLAKMKLPMDVESGPASSENSSSDQQLQTPKSTGSRVFYGSRAFF